MLQACTKLPLNNIPLLSTLLLDVSLARNAPGPGHSNSDFNSPLLVLVVPSGRHPRQLAFRGRASLAHNLRHLRPFLCHLIPDSPDEPTGLRRQDFHRTSGGHSRGQNEGGGTYLPDAQAPRLDPARARLASGDRQTRRPRSPSQRRARTPAQTVGWLTTSCLSSQPVRAAWPRVISPLPCRRPVTGRRLAALVSSFLIR